MKFLVTILFVLSYQLLGAQQYNEKNAESHLDWTVQQLYSKNSKSVLVAAHRGDWRNAPENSIQAIKNCIEMGVDIVEIDLKTTKDGHLILMHDKTIDRTTNGKGVPEQYTLEEIKKFRLKDGLGHLTNHPIPTLEEVLDITKGKIVLNFDKGYSFFNQAYNLILNKGMVKQIIYNTKENTSIDSLYYAINEEISNQSNDLPCDRLDTKRIELDSNLFIMAVLNAADNNNDEIIKSFLQHKNIILQVYFSSDTVSILKKIPYLKANFRIWYNSLWPELCANHNDDKAIQNDEDKNWGWLIAMGANIIQSDRALQLLQYLKTKGLHP